jgi:hypothetical protein
MGLSRWLISHQMGQTEKDRYRRGTAGQPPTADIAGDETTQPVWVNICKRRAGLVRRLDPNKQTLALR